MSSPAERVGEDDRRRPAPRSRVHLAASGGGHLDLLRRVVGALGDRERTWVTAAGRTADDLRDSGERVLGLPALDRRHRSLANPTIGLAYAARERPRLVVTSGAGTVLPFCAAARALGARIVFVETMARVSDSSAAGRVLARLARRTFVQWPEMRGVHPGAVACRPALFEGLEDAAPRRGRGTVVALGTHHQPFDRLLSLVDSALAAGVLSRPVVAQVGAGFSARAPDWDEVAETLPAERMRAAIAAADVVVCHAGAGIIATALRAGKRPLVLPRLARHGEHVDDHQEQLAAKVEALGLGVRIGDAITAADIDAAHLPIRAPRWPRELPPLEDALREALATL